MKQSQPAPFPSFQLSTNKTNKFNCILLIDDDCITNFINASLLRKITSCKTITTFKNGKDALDFIQPLVKDSENFPDLIFLDIHMPVMDGYEFVNILKALVIPVTSKIVILSTSLRTRDVERLKLAGIQYFIDKPLTENKVIRIIEKMNGV